MEPSRFSPPYVYRCPEAFARFAQPTTRRHPPLAPTQLPSDGATCSAGSPVNAAPADLAAMLERIRLEAFAETTDESGPYGIVLNNRGYNYGPAPTRNSETLAITR